jgi:CRP/FNR family transcriptional regulator
VKSLVEKAFFLKRVRLFAELDLELLLAIAEKLHEDDYDAGEKVFTSGQVANRIYLIAKGSATIIDEKGSFVKELGAHDYFGDEAIFNDGARSYSAICKTDSLLFALSRSHLLSIISECPSVAIALLQAYAQTFPCRHHRGGMFVP